MVRFERYFMGELYEIDGLQDRQTLADSGNANFF